MIVEMKRVWLICQEQDRSATLDALGELGVVHVTPSQPPAGDALDSHRALASEIQQAQVALQHAAHESQTAPATNLVDTLPARQRVERVLELVAAQAEAVGRGEVLAQEIGRIEPLGDFDPTQIAALAARGLNVALYTLPTKHAVVPPDGAMLETVGQSGDTLYLAVISSGSVELETATPVRLPEQSLGELRRKLDATRATAAEIAAELLAQHAALGEIEELQTLTAADIERAEVESGMGSDRAMSYLSGYVPAEQGDALKQAALQHGWGIVLREVSADEAPPTQVRMPRWTKPIQGVFDMLGVLPGYREADTSSVFLIFFSIFFAILIGDAGYGALILLATLWGRRKLPKAPGYPFVLFGILGSVTILWGVLTGNYFGIPQSALPELMQPRTGLGHWLTNRETGQDNMMQLCFLIGAMHLTVAHVWNTLVLFPNRKALAQVGWGCMVWTMYAMACNMVLQQPLPVWAMPCFGVGLVLIVLFMTDPKELKANMMDHIMLPLSLVNCLVDVISYIRLFAVGMASLQVAQSFNGMALGMDLPLALRIPVVALILLLGHGLNIALGALGILVHAVRLNTLEFSQHKGLEWAGSAYRPFRRLRNKS
jgi:V/A-type H+-transporting ATPase subunit I